MRLNNKNKYIILLLLAFFLFYGYFYNKNIDVSTNAYAIDTIPEYNGKLYIELNNNIPYFTEKDYELESYEIYGELDSLGRCSTAIANIGIDLMPTKERGSIGMIKPTGWHTIKYDNISGKYLYNRCHLIGYQLTGEGANEKNLITCTRQMNINGMVSFENKVSEYIRKTSNHVLYRVTPYFEGVNLLATGVEIEGYSIEDNGKGISFNVFVYNVQDGIDINYLDGSSMLCEQKQ